MSGFLHLMHAHDGSDSDGPPVDPDVSLAVAYVARELSLVEMAAVEERLADDPVFRERVRFVFDIAALPIAFAEDAGVQPRLGQTPAASVREIEAGWQRYRRGTSTAPPTTTGRATAGWQRPWRTRAGRVAAVVALVAAPVFVIAQVISRLTRPETVVAPATAAADRPRSVSMSGLSSAGASDSQNAAAPQGVPIVDLPPATRHSTETFGGIIGVHELPGRRLVVDDGGWRQVRVLDSSLAVVSTVVDSARGATTAYGPMTRPLIPFLEDSALFPYAAGPSLLVIGPSGAVARALALPIPGMVTGIRRGAADNMGRLIFPVNAEVTRPLGNGFPATVVDSAPLVRIDLSLRRTDTIAYVRRPLTRVDLLQPNGSATSYFYPDPLGTIDEWAVLTDGSIALVRGLDYHVDWIRPGGTRLSTPKLPFAIRRYSDADKERMIDSVLAQREAAARANTLVVMAERVAPWVDVSIRATPVSDRAPKPDTTGGIPTRTFQGANVIVLRPERPAADRVPDYTPPVRSGGVLADRDNQLWILPATSTQSRAGELVYDVVSSGGTLVKHVRVPTGRFIVGFGRSGVVYLATGNLTSGFTIERSALPPASR